MPATFHTYTSIKSQYFFFKSPPILVNVYVLLNNNSPMLFSHMIDHPSQCRCKTLSISSKKLLTTITNYMTIAICFFNSRPWSQTGFENLLVNLSLLKWKDDNPALGKSPCLKQVKAS